MLMDGDMNTRRHHCIGPSPDLDGGGRSNLQVTELFRGAGDQGLCPAAFGRPLGWGVPSPALPGATCRPGCPHAPGCCRSHVSWSLHFRSGCVALQQHTLMTGCQRKGCVGESKGCMKVCMQNRRQTKERTR